MSKLVRLSLSLEKDLLDRLDALVRERGFENRSEYVRDLVRDKLVEKEWAHDTEVLATLTLAFDHHARRLGEKLVDLQHHHHHEILATTHMHLSEHLCAEMIMIRGTARQVRTIADLLVKQKGILHSALAMSSTGEALV